MKFLSNPILLLSLLFFFSQAAAAFNIARLVQYAAPLAQQGVQYGAVVVQAAGTPAGLAGLSLGVSAIPLYQIGTNRGWYHFFQSSSPNLTDFSPPVEQLTFDEPTEKDVDVSEWLAPTKTVITTTQTVGQFPTATTSVIHYTVVYSGKEEPVMEVTSEVVDVSTDTPIPSDQCLNIPLAYFTHQSICPAVFPVLHKKPYRPDNSAVLLPAAQPDDDAPYLLAAVRVLLTNSPDPATISSWFDVVYDFMIEFQHQKGELFVVRVIQVVLLGCIGLLALVKSITFTILKLCDMISSCFYMCHQTWNTRRDMAFERNTERLERREALEIRAQMAKLRPQVYVQEQRQHLEQQGTLEREQTARATKIAQDEQYEPLEHNNALARVQRSRQTVILEEDLEDIKSSRAIQREVRGQELRQALAIDNGPAPYLQIENRPDSSAGGHGGKGKDRAIEGLPGGESSGSNTASQVDGPEPTDDQDKKDAIGSKPASENEDENSDDKGDNDDDDNDDDSNPPPPGAESLVRRCLPLMPDLDDESDAESPNSSPKQSNVAAGKRRAETRTVSVGNATVPRLLQRVEDFKNEAYQQKPRLKKFKSRDFSTESCSEGESGEKEGEAQDLTANDDETQHPPELSTNEESQRSPEAETSNTAPISADKSNREVSKSTGEDPQLSVESELENEQNGTISPKLEDGNTDASAQATVEESLQDEAEISTEEEKEFPAQTEGAELTEEIQEATSLAGAHEQDDKLVENTTDETNPSATTETEQSPAAPTGDEAEEIDSLFDESKIDEEKLAADSHENAEAQAHSTYGSQDDPSDDQPKKSHDEGERQSITSPPEDAEPQTAALTENSKAQTPSAHGSQNETNPPAAPKSDNPPPTSTEEKDDEDDWESDSSSSADDGNLTAAFVQNNVAQAQERSVNGNQDETSSEQSGQTQEAFSSNESAGGIVPLAENQNIEVAAPVPPQAALINERTSRNSRPQGVREPCNAWSPYGRNTRTGGRSERGPASLSSRVQAGARGNRAGELTNVDRPSLFQQTMSEMDAGGSNTHQTSLSTPRPGTGYNFNFNSMVQQQAPTPPAALMLGPYTIEVPSQPAAPATAPFTLGRYTVDPPPQAQPEAIPLPYTSGDDAVDFPDSQQEATVPAPSSCESTQAEIDPAQVPLPFTPGDDEIDFPVRRRKAREPAQTTSETLQVIIDLEADEESKSAAPTLGNHTLEAPEQQEQEFFSMQAMTDVLSQMQFQLAQEDQAALQAQHLQQAQAQAGQEAQARAHQEAQVRYFREAQARYVQQAQAQAEQEAQARVQQEAQTMRLAAQDVPLQAAHTPLPLLFFNPPQEPQDQEMFIQDAANPSPQYNNDMEHIRDGPSAPSNPPATTLPGPSGGHHGPQQAPRVHAEAHSRISYDPAQDDVLIDEDNMEAMFGNAYGTDASAFDHRFGYQPTLPTNSGFPSATTVEAPVSTVAEQAVAFPGFGRPQQGIESGDLYGDRNSKQGSPEPMTVDGNGDEDGDWQDPDVDMDDVDMTQPADTVPAMMPQFDNQYVGDMGDFQEAQQPLEDFQEDDRWNEPNYGPVAFTDEEVRDFYQQGGLLINSTPVPQDQTLHSAWDPVATVASQDRFGNAFRPGADPNVSLSGRLRNDQVHQDWLNKSVYADADQFEAPGPAGEWLDNNIPFDEDEGPDANKAGWTGEDADFDDGSRRELDDADKDLRALLDHDDSPRSGPSGDNGSSLGRRSPPNQNYADDDGQEHTAYESQSESDGKPYVVSDAGDPEAQFPSQDGSNAGEDWEDPDQDLSDTDSNAERERLYQEGLQQIRNILAEHQVAPTRPDLPREFEPVPGQGNQERVAYDWVVRNPGWLRTPLGQHFLESDPTFASTRSELVVARLRYPATWELPDHESESESEDESDESEEE
ncbi:hypothetical protein LTR84_007833 [Exophiala bonariae]|uniref:Uncharacterized protein n=1 Tax=Exophiala bonariae TaxID=1690606 RepID=A0AAV9NMU3_9EURO|nr:hypothetical protein LTR84_007833 [Exophiala bonariae]